MVTQPGFISARGDDYLRDVPASEQAWLYPCAALARAGAAVAAGTDAPFGPADPWRCVAAAVSRRAPSGRVVGRPERLSPARALRLFLTAPEDPGRLREVRPGQPGDLCVLRAPLRTYLSRPAADGVRAGIIAGQVFEAERPESQRLPGDSLKLGQRYLRRVIARRMRQPGNRAYNVRERRTDRPGAAKHAAA